MSPAQQSDAVSHSDDALLGGRVTIRQPVKGYRVAVDPVLLAAAVSAKGGMNVLDAGCGSGAAMFCLAARIPGLSLTGLEIQRELANCARAGLELNRLTGSARIIDGDIANPPRDFKTAFDIVITNPPFADGGTTPPDEMIAKAHMETNVDLRTWIASCMACLKQKGRLVLIHRADRLSDIFAALHGRAGDIRIWPVYPSAGAPARRVIIDAGKGRKSPDTLHAGLILHDQGGGHTREAEQVLRAAESLPI